MNFENTNYNEVLISGTINNIKKLNKYIAFGLTCKTFLILNLNVLLVFIYTKIFIIFIRIFFIKEIRYSLRAI